MAPPPEPIRWALAGPMTDLDHDDLRPVLSDLPRQPVDLCRVAQGLVLLPNLAPGVGVPAARIDAERSIRPAAAILRALLSRDGRPLEAERPLAHRVVGTCRHFAVLACAFLRYRGMAARARCGFAAYFSPGRFVDHWVVEHRPAGGERWVRIDPEILGFGFVADPTDLQEGEFLSGGEAWRACRSGAADPDHFGVDGVPEVWGISEVRGNLVRDLAALNKVETLPWDEWGRMRASYDGTTGADYDELMDELAATCASDDEAALVELYRREDLAVPVRRRTSS